MKKSKESKQLSVSGRMRAAEALGTKVAKIISKAQLQANKLLNETNHNMNLEILEDGSGFRLIIVKKEEVDPNG